MIPVLLALSLVAIDPADAEFARLQVDWIVGAAKPRDLEAVLPREQAELIRLLGDDRELVRSLARDALARRGESAHEALCWGMRAKDPKVAHECRLLRERLFACPACKGNRHCRRCDGTGDVRYLRTHCVDDRGQAFEVLILKDLFMQEVY